MFKSRTVQATAEGGLFTIGMALVVVGTGLLEKGDVVGGALALAAGALILVISRYVHLPQ